MNKSRIIRKLSVTVLVLLSTVACAGRKAPKEFSKNSAALADCESLEGGDILHGSTLLTDIAQCPDDCTGLFRSLNSKTNDSFAFLCNRFSEPTATFQVPNLPAGDYAVTCLGGAQPEPLLLCRFHLNAKETTQVAQGPEETIADVCTSNTDCVAGKTCEGGSCVDATTPTTTAPVAITPTTPTPPPPPAPAPTPTPTVIVDKTPPRILTVTPFGKGNDRTTNVTINFSEPMDPQSLQQFGAFLVLPANGNPSDCFGGGSWEKTELTDNNTKATLVFTKPLENCAFLAHVNGNVKDKAGNVLGANYSWTFETKDGTAPIVIGTTPVWDGAHDTNEVSLTFSEPMNPDSTKVPFLIVPDDDISLCLTGSWKSTTWNAKRTQVTVTYTKPLGPCKFRGAVNTALTDVAGNHLEEFQWAFVIQKDPLADLLSLREYYRIDGSGGNGGGFSESLCNDGEVVVGLSLVVENGVIASIIGYACQEINHLDDTSSWRWTTINPIRQVGATRHDYIAPAGELFVGFHTKTAEMSDALVVGEFVPTFAKLGEKGIDASSIHQSSMIVGKGSSDAWSSQICPTGYAQVGLRIRSGGYIDRLGNVCRRVTPANEAEIAASSQPTISEHEGFEFGFVEYNWDASSMGMGENWQPTMGANRVEVLDCGPGYGIVSTNAYYNGVFEGFFDVLCQKPDLSYKVLNNVIGSTAQLQLGASFAAQKMNYLTGWGHKRSEWDCGDTQTGYGEDWVMVSELQLFRTQFDNKGNPSAATFAGSKMGEGINWDCSDDNYTDWINETCPAGFVLSGIKMKIENGTPRALGGICRRMIPAGQEPGHGEANPRT